jgi:hypothetical protein
MAHGAPTPTATHDCLLVFGVAAAILGVVMVSQGVLVAQPVTHLLPSEHAALMPVGHTESTPAEPLVPDTSPTTGVPPMPAGLTASGDATRLVTTCPPHFAFDHDLRQVLAAMALQGQRFAREHPVAPGKQDVPTQSSALVGAEKSVSVTRAAASPQAARRTNVPGC